MSWSIGHNACVVGVAALALLGSGCSCGAPTEADGGPSTDATVADGGETPRWIGVDAVAQSACAVRSDGLAICWGQGWAGGHVLPTPLASVRVGGEIHACGLDAEGALQCFLGDFGIGPFPVEWNPPAGAFVALALYGGAACAIDEAGVATCWANDQPSAMNPVFPPPTSEPLASISVLGVACSVTVTGTGLCWTPFFEGPPQPPPVPEGTYTTIEWDGTGACGLRTDGEVVCWSESADWLSVMVPPPAGPFVELSVGLPTCALRPTGEAVCWGYAWLDGPPPGPLAPLQPAGERYEHIATGSFFFCGILLDGRLSCWGYNEHGQTDAP